MDVTGLSTGSPAASAGNLLDVLHENAYDYGGRVSLAHHLAYLRPRDLPWQRVLSYGLVTIPQASWRTVITDSYGNTRELFSHYAPHESLMVHATSRVSVAARFEDLDPSRGMSCDAVRNLLRYRAEGPYVAEAEFAFASPYVPLHEELAAYARPCFSCGGSVVQGAIELMGRIHADFTYSSGSTEISTPVLEAFHMRKGVCQDFAHVMIGALRALGLAARYVSGYLLTHPPPGKPRLVGADASHAWVSVWCPVLGWVDLDPTNDVLPGSGHVTLAMGRDYGDVTPLRGVIRGVGTHDLHVGVTVSQVEPGA